MLVHNVFLSGLIFILAKWVEGEEEGELHNSHFIRIEHEEDTERGGGGKETEMKGERPTNREMCSTSQEPHLHSPLMCRLDYASFYLHPN